MRTQAFILVLGLLFLSPDWVAQEKVKRFELALGFGVYASSPSKRLADHMIEHQFNRSVSTFFFGTIRYPLYEKSGRNFFLTANFKLSDKSLIGLLYSNIDLGQTSGYAIENGHGLHLDVNLTSDAFIPYYAFYLDNVQLKAGMGLVLNENFQTSQLQNRLKYSNTVLGYMVGMDVVIIDTGLFILKASSHYISSRIIIGPFPAENRGTVKELPETEIDFGHIDFAISTGLKI